MSLYKSFFFDSLLEDETPPEGTIPSKKSKSEPTSDAAKKAAEAGLELVGVGLYGKDGKASHRSVTAADGKTTTLEPIAGASATTPQPTPAVGAATTPTPPKPPRTQTPKTPVNQVSAPADPDKMDRDKVAREFTDFLEKQETDNPEVFNGIPKYLKLSSGKLNVNRIKNTLAKWFSTVDLEKVKLLDPTTTALDIVAMATSNSSKDFGNFQKFKTLQGFADAVKVDINSPALAGLLDSYLRIYNPDIFEFIRADTLDNRQKHLEYYLGNGQGATRYFKSLNKKIDSIIFGEGLIKKLFMEDKDGKFVVHKLLAKMHGFSPKETEEEWMAKYEELLPKKKASTKIAQFNRQKKEIINLLFPPAPEEGDVDYAEGMVPPQYERDAMNNFLRNLLVGAVYDEDKKNNNYAYGQSEDRDLILDAIDGIRNKVTDSIATTDKFKHLGDIQKGMVKSITEYQKTLSSIQTEISQNPNPSPEDFSKAKASVDMALTKVFGMEIADMTDENVNKKVTSILTKILAKLAESHEFYRELVGGDEVYLPEYIGFPCGDKLKVSRKWNSDKNELLLEKIERVSVKSGPTESQTGAQSELGKYPLSEGIYKTLGLGSMGWQASQPFQLSREYAENDEYYNEMLSDSGVVMSDTENPKDDQCLRGDKVKQFQELIKSLQVVGTGGVSPTDKRAHFTEKGIIKKGDFPGDRELRRYKSIPREGEAPSLSRKIFEQLVNDINPTEVGLSGASVVSTGTKNAKGKIINTIDNDEDKGDSYLGYIIETLASAYGEEAIEKIKDNKLIATKTANNVSVIDMPKTMENVSNLVLPEYFDMNRLKTAFGKQNYTEALKRGPLYVFAAMTTLGALKKHNGFKDIVEHRHYILEVATKARRRSLSIREYTGRPTLRDWFVKYDMFQTIDKAWNMSTNKGGFSAAVRGTCKGLDDNGKTSTTSYTLDPLARNPATPKTINSALSSSEFKPVTKKALPYKQHGEVATSSALKDMAPMTFATATSEMRVVTVTADGKETENTAMPGDIIMSGPSAEKYVVKATKFAKLYTKQDDDTVVPEQSPRQVTQYKGEDEITFTAPWGEDMVLKPGDYVVKDGDGYYRIAKKEYETMYNLPGAKKKKAKTKKSAEPKTRS